MNEQYFKTSAAFIFMLYSSPYFCFTSYAIVLPSGAVYIPSDCLETPNTDKKKKGERKKE